MKRVVARRSWAVATALALGIAACTAPDYRFGTDAPQGDDAGLDARVPLPEPDAEPSDASVDAGPQLCADDEVAVTSSGVTHCYFFTTAMVTCKVGCGTDPRTHLVAFEELDELDRVALAIEPKRMAKGVRYWIGLVPTGDASTTDRATFKWVTKPLLGYFSKWADLPDRQPTGGAACVLQDSSAVDQFGNPNAWFDHADQTDLKFALCEREP